jgi:hypothetical protein
MYKIYRRENYFIMISPTGRHWEELAHLVRISKVFESDTTYSIKFSYYPELSIEFDDITDEMGAPFGSQSDWENWYMANTGIESMATDMNTLFGYVNDLETLISTLSNYISPYSTTSTIILRPTNSGTIVDDVRSISISNVGVANGTVNTVSIKPGETINIDAGGIRNRLTASSIAYNATGTEFLIVYTK